MFRLFHKRSGPLVSGDTSGERFLRFMLLITIFAVCGWLFSYSFERKMQQIQAGSSIWDQTGQLSDDQKTAFRDVVAQYRKEFGLNLKLLVSKSPVEPPEIDSKTIFIGLCPGRKEAVVLFPPLVAKALGPEFQRTLVEEHFPAFFARDDWPTGLILALEKLWNGLQSPDTPAAPAQSR